MTTLDEEKINRALYLDTKADDQLTKLRLKLGHKYHLESHLNNMSRKSEQLFQFVHSDDEAYLYCLVYLEEVKYDEKKIFSLLFTYPEIVRLVRRLRD